MISVYSDEKGKEHATGSETSVPRFPYVEAMALGMYKRVALNVTLHARRAQDVVNAFVVSDVNVKTTEMKCLSHMFFLKNKNSDVILFM